MYKHNPHRGLDPLIETIRARQDNKLAIVFSWKFAELLPNKNSIMGRIIEYIELALRVWQHRHFENIIIREFSTYFFFLTLFLVFPIRKKCILLIAHNIQKAKDSSIERSLLLIIRYFGVRYACLENSEGVLNVLGANPSVVIPHPVNNFTYKFTKNKSLVVGVAGDMRPEKGLEFIIPILAHGLSTQKNQRFFVGTNKPNLIAKNLPNTTIIDTTDSREYINFLHQIDLLVLPYPPENYQYRASGVIADATAAGTIVITTNLPVISSQILTPSPSGITLPINDFRGDVLFEAINRVADEIDLYKIGVEQNAEVRQSANIVTSILNQLDL